LHRMTTNEPESGINLRSIGRAVRRRLGVFILVVLLAPAAALGFSLSQEDEYQATAELLFRDPGLDQKLFGSTFFSEGDPQREAATNVKLVSLDVVAARTAAALPGEVTRGDVDAMVNASSEANEDVVSVTATDTDPEFAALVANTFATEYIAFRREADRTTVRRARELVERQLERLNEEGLGGTQRVQSLAAQAEQLRVLAALQTGNAELVQRAEPPNQRISPKPVRNTLVGGVLGVMLAIALVLLFERIDRRVRDVGEVEAIFDRPVLGAIPQSKALQRRKKTDGVLLGTESEAFRMLRANLRYVKVAHPVNSVLVTSAAPADGKSTVAWNIAAAAASAGTQTLLIEADLRHPSLAESYGLSSAVGLSSLLAGRASLNESRQTVTAASLLAGGASLNESRQTVTVAPARGGSPERMMDVIVAGPLPPNPHDLIESVAMRDLMHEAEKQYELVVIDTPPASVVSDAIPLVSEVSGVLVVARLSRSKRDSLVHLRNQLRNLDAVILGVVVNFVGGDQGPYGYEYGYGYAASNIEEPPGDEERSPSGVAS